MAEVKLETQTRSTFGKKNNSLRKWKMTGEN